MAQPIVIQLQELASSSNYDITDLLRKGLMVATKLGLSEFRDWILFELNGYPDDCEDKLPSYRIIWSHLRVSNPYRGLQAFSVPEEIHDRLARVLVWDSIASISELVSDAQNQHIISHFPPQIERKLMSMQGEIRLQPVRVIGTHQFLAIISAVRTRILQWALSLEAEGILGDGLSFSVSEKQTAMHSQNIRIENFQGVLGNVQGSSVTQNNTQNVTASDFSSLARYLASHGVGDAEIRELEQAVCNDPAPTGKGFGPKVCAWIGKMTALAASGGWEIGVAAAGNVLGTALSKFYGIG